jgi:hypothetical protein
MKLNRKIYETQREKRNDFIGGFFGWFLVNFATYFVLSMVAGAVIYLIERLSGGELGPSTLIVISILPLIFNVGLIYFLAKTRKWMAYGALAAIAASLILVVVLGAFIAVACSGNW